jgi:hypothetical protein
MPTGYKKDPELQKKLHHPKEFVGSLDPRNGARAAGEKLLRASEKYLDFLALFGKFGCNPTTYKNYFRSRRFQNMVSEGMEAFLVTVYNNNYENWNQEDEEEEMRQVRLSGRKRKEDCSGWTDAGVELFDNFAKEIIEQRTNIYFGARFDEQLQDLWTEMHKKGEGGGRVRPTARKLAIKSGFEKWAEGRTGEKFVGV